MAKNKSHHKDKAALHWAETDLGYIPVVQVGDIALRLEPRPMRQFYENEREAMMFQMGNMIAEKLFGFPRHIPNEFGHIVEHPAWKDLESIPLDIKRVEEPESKIVGLSGQPVN
jgi:hypothetical protein